MAIANRVKETTATTGTGSFTTSGAAAGFQTFNTAFGLNVRFTYWAVNDTDNEWETGIGYLSGTTTLVRDRVLDNSSNGTTAISFTTAPSLFCGENESTLTHVAEGFENTITHVCSSATTVSYATGTLGADWLYLVPFKYEQINRQISGMVVDVTAAGAGGTIARMGIYSIGSDGLPNQLLAEGNGTVSVATTGSKSISFAANINLPSGWYYSAIISDGTPTVRAHNNNMHINPLNISQYHYGQTYAYKTIASFSAMPTTPITGLSISQGNPPRLAVTPV